MSKLLKYQLFSNLISDIGGTVLTITYATLPCLWVVFVVLVLVSLLDCFAWGYRSLTSSAYSYHSTFNL